MYETIRESEYGDSPRNYYLAHRGDTLRVELTYPNIGPPERARFVYLNQESTRASDGVRLHYDYARDGWVVCQPGKSVWRGDDEEMDEDWGEVAFIASWARMETEDEMYARFDRENSAQTGGRE